MVLIADSTYHNTPGSELFSWEQDSEIYMYMCHSVLLAFPVEIIAEGTTILWIRIAGKTK